MKYIQPVWGAFLISFLLSCQAAETKENKTEEKVEEVKLELSKDEPSVPLLRDPVCGMELREGSDSLVHEGKIYHFCSATCKQDFEKDPKAYTAKK
jgi:hypothetical protein